MSLALAVGIPGAAAVETSGVEAASPLQVTGLTYGTAQTVRWLDDRHFLVGRWDGAITVFRAPPGHRGAPRLEAALAMPGGEAVRLLLPRDGRSFVSSGRAGSPLVWREDSAGQFSAESVDYPAGHGFAVSGLFVRLAGEDYLVTGHEMGQLLVWSVSEGLGLTLQRAVDLRLAAPIDYLHADEPLRHIRGLAMWRDGIVIAGGEDGGLHQVQLPGGEVLAQRVFNPAARLGVNNLAVHGDRLLAVNCALDQRDSNLWLYDLERGAIEHRDSTNLLEDKSRDHIFAFEVLTYADDGEPVALVTTKEGQIWRVRFDEGELQALAPLQLGRVDYGNAIDYDESSRRLATAGVGVRIVDFDGE